MLKNIHLRHSNPAFIKNKFIPVLAAERAVITIGAEYAAGELVEGDVGVAVVGGFEYAPRVEHFDKAAVIIAVRLHQVSETFIPIGAGCRCSDGSADCKSSVRGE
ncbi:hypothetical protein SAMN05216216_10145 [Lacicoccus qingdaonensis]|uniref:Uncharacterized protein n=1 Tax=Lacicoccus qingdaonensis TaxID=576118 RepID=A0A1G9A149_9BACL|nr:hypothetical protein SAMN05216216_10145 [Salinicoccus qingdaonensis]